jgi:hypothetical protein
MATDKQNPKLELRLNESAKIKLLKDKCYEGENGYGKFYLYSVEHQGEAKSFFAPADVHAQIVAHGLKAGSVFILRKIASQNGKKLVGELVFEMVEQEKASPEEFKLEPTNGNDDFREIMAHCLADAIAIVKSVQADGVPFQAEDLRAISSCLFIARTRVN